MTAFPPEKTISFFEEHGCPLKTERGNRVFPVTDRSQSILDCLQRELRRQKVTVIQEAVSQILVKDGKVCGVQTTKAVYEARWVILATGGVSYPATGSTGDGYAMAKGLGHTVVTQEGNLVPLEVVGPDCKQMQGLSRINIRFAEIAWSH